MRAFVERTLGTSCWRGVITLGAVLALAACESIRDRQVTAENAAEVIGLLQQSHDVTPEELELVQQYIARSQLGGILSALAVDAPLPATVNEMIERQRAFRDRMAAAAAERQAVEAREAEAARVAAERARAEMEALRATIPGTVTSLTFRGHDYRAGRISDDIVFAAHITNLGTVGIRGVRGRFIFVDTFGHDVATLALGVEEDIAPNTSFDGIFTHDYNQFMETDQALRAFDLTRGTVRWEPVQVVYADGTSVELTPIP